MSRKGRSGRSSHKSRSFTGSKKAVGRPTARKDDYYAWMRSIRGAEARKGG